jgi:carboxyl-terminal processing protease
MSIAFLSQNIRRTILLIGLCASTALVAADRKFSTSSTLSTEARTLVQLLEQAHYNRDAVKSSDYTQVIPDYMSELDGQHLFFLNSDKVAFVNKFGRSVYENVSYLGNIDAAYQIFTTYETRVEARINWIFEELKKDFDLKTNATYRKDRTKSDWPAIAANADELWQDHLKLELIDEMLNKKTIDEAKVTVRKRYERMLKNLSEIEGRDLAEIYLSCIARLYDPHSTYFSAETFEDFSIQMKLQLVGIGALLSVEDDNCAVKEIVPGGPADIGRQLKPNDRIIAVAQAGAEPVEVIGMKLRKVVDMIRGQKNTQVRLIVQPADATDPSVRKEIVITRDVVKLNSARAHAAIFQVPAADGKTSPLGVITLPAFYGPAEDGDTDSAGEKTSATKDVARLIGQLQQAGITGLVLDLRRNGGGYLTEAIDLTGLFIKRGPVVQVKDYSGAIQVDSDNADSVAYSGPLAVLVDRFSASASEIVTGALQNYGRAIIIGDSSTHGKGTVQTVMEMKNISRLLASSPAKTGAAKITIQKFYLPDGASTQLKGVVPDIILPSIDDYLPIGETALPHALVWDQIPTSFYDGAPLDTKILSPLRKASLERQSQLEEFTFLKKNIDWFKSRQEQKLVSLNLVDRQQQKISDTAYRKEMNTERERLAKSDFTFKEFRLGPPPAPRIKAAKKDTDDPDDIDTSSEENESYGKVDIHLREALRVVEDSINLGKSHVLSVSNHPSLTANSKG